jgi:SNF2 family DNA or RNA helicase
MSGTPFHNTALDIYAPYRFLSPDIFGTSFAKMKARYAEEDYFGGVANIINEDELHRKFYRIAYRVKTDDVLDLPEETEVIRKCDLEPEARIAYGELEQHMITQVKDGVITATNGAVKVMRLIQLTGGWLKDEEENYHKVSSAKSNLLGELLDDLPLREPIIVFCYFHKDMDSIRQICEKKERTVAELSGRTSAKDQEKITEWIDGERDVLISQIRSGSSGINWMVRAHIGIVYSLGHLSHGDWDQARRRLVREGQTKPVQFIHLHAQSTRDSSVLNALRRKTDVVKYILDEMKGENDEESKQ